MPKKDLDLVIKRRTFVQTKVLILIHRKDIHSVNDALRHIADECLFCSHSLVKRIYKGTA